MLFQWEPIHFSPFLYHQPWFHEGAAAVYGTSAVLLGAFYVLQRDDHPSPHQQRGIGWDRWGKVDIPDVVAPQGKAGSKSRQHSQLD